MITQSKLKELMYSVVVHRDMYRGDLDLWWIAENEILPSGTKMLSYKWGPYNNEHAADEMFKLAEEGVISHERRTNL